MLEPGLLSPEGATISASFLLVPDFDCEAGVFIGACVCVALAELENVMVSETDILGFTEVVTVSFPEPGFLATWERIVARAFLFDFVEVSGVERVMALETEILGLG